MKKKPLSHYFDLIKSALDKQDSAKAKRYGEIALKKLPNLSYSPLEEYLLYSRLGNAYIQLAEYSRSLDILYKASLIASKHHFDAVYIAYTSYMNGYNFLVTGNISQALFQFQKVEEYYQKHGDATFPMDKVNYFYSLVYLGHCYLYKNNIEKVKEIIEKKLSPYLLYFSNDAILMTYHYFNGEYLIEIKEYDQARQSLIESTKFSKQINATRVALNTQIHLASIELLGKRLESAIQILQETLKGARRLRCNDVVCETGLLLSKCYSMKNMPLKAAYIEKRIKSVLSKLDIIWVYEKTRELEQLYHQLQPIYYDDIKSVPTILTNTINKHYKSSPYKDIIIGQSTPMVELYQLVEKVAPTDLPILIQGETGTGKELVARTVYHNSLRKEKTWLALNCGVIPETLLTNGLFGHTKGAFTDAHKDKKGYIELASEGTLFLDEISEMSPAMQQKLLRVLEEKLVWRVGSEKPIPVNPRFIFASNQNIEELVKSKKFREDLFYRINTIVITLPPLRDRKEDIPFLVQHLWKKYKVSLIPPKSPLIKGGMGGLEISHNAQPASPAGERRTQNAQRITPDALSLLINYPWPGNIRELENEIKRIYALYPDVNLINELMVSENIRNYKSIPTLSSGLTSLKALKGLAERDIIIESLRKCKGNINQTACLLELDPSNLHKKIKQLKITVSK